MLDSGYRCPRCNTLLEGRAVVTYDGGNCACSTGDCTCGYDTEMVCPQCSGYGERNTVIIVDSMTAAYADKEKELKKSLKKLVEDVLWLGDKKSRQRENNRYKQKQQFSKKFDRHHYHQKRGRRK